MTSRLILMLHYSQWQNTSASISNSGIRVVHETGCLLTSHSN